MYVCHKKMHIRRCVMRCDNRNKYAVFKTTLVQGAHFGPVFEMPMLAAVDSKPARACPSSPTCAGGMSAPTPLPSRAWRRVAVWPSAPTAPCATSGTGRILRRAWPVWWRCYGPEPLSITARRPRTFLGRTGPAIEIIVLPHYAQVVRKGGA